MRRATLAGIRKSYTFLPPWSVIEVRIPLETSPILSGGLIVDPERMPFLIRKRIGYPIVERDAGDTSDEG